MCEEPLYYFAYGSNLSVPRLQARICATPIGIALLPEYRLAFHKRGKDGSGKCDAFLTANPADGVWGRLYRIGRSDQQRLDDIEGLGRGYDRTQADFSLPDGEVRAFFYTATDIDTTLHPFSWYLAHVLHGAKDAQLPQNYIRAIEAQNHRADDDKSRHRREMAIYD